MVWSGGSFPSENKEAFLWSEEPEEFPAPSAVPGTTSAIKASGEGRPAVPGFLGKAVGSVHENLEYWKKTFEYDSYAFSILKDVYKIPAVMTAQERRTVYRERNNQSAHNEMSFVRKEVARLLEKGQIIEVPAPVLCTNPLTVAFKVNLDGTIKKRLVINLSRWVNGFIRPDSYRMARFQDALDQSAKGDFQSVFDVSAAYHHLRLAPESYDLGGLCVEDVDGKERYYHYVVVVFGLGPAGQALGRVMQPILIFLTQQGICYMTYVDNGRTAAATKARADRDYAATLSIFEAARFTVSKEKSDKLGNLAQRKEKLGFVIDTKEITIHMPVLKLARVLKILQEFLSKRRHWVRDVASVVGKLIVLEPAVGRSVLIETRLATIAIVAATDVYEAVKMRGSSWGKSIELDDDTHTALFDVWLHAAEWNGCPIRCWHTGINSFVSITYGGYCILGQKGAGVEVARLSGCHGERRFGFRSRFIFCGGPAGVLFFGRVVSGREIGIIFYKRVVGYSEDLAVLEVTGFVLFCLCQESIQHYGG